MAHRIHAGARIGQVTLKVSNLERSIQFYSEVVGFRLLHQTQETAELTVDGKNPLLTLTYIPDATILPRRTSAGLYHFAILVPDRMSLGLVLRNLIAHKIEIGQGDHAVSEALYIRDPDNNGIELYADRPREGWQRDSEGFYVMGTDPIDVDGLLSLSENIPWDGLPHGTVIGHVHFHVSNLRRAEEFYCDLLGFELTARYDSSAAFVSAGGYHHHIGLNIWAGEGAPPASEDAVGLDHYEIVLPDRAALETLLGRLTAAGYSVRESDGAAYVKDPFQIQMKLVTE